MPAQAVAPEDVAVPEAVQPPLRRPRTRGECVDGPRPCPWATCRHHLPAGRCALDVAALGEHTDAEIALLIGVTRSRVQQIARTAIEKLRRAGEAGALDPDVLSVIEHRGEDVVARGRDEG